MKTLLSIALATAFSFSAFANDGGVAHIDVQGINPAVKAENGTTIKFYGQNAANFMRLLPGYSNVLYDMVSDYVSEQIQENERGVTLVSNGWSLSFNCSGGQLNGYDREATFTKTQTECTVSLEKNYDGRESAYDMLGDTWPMEPKNFRKNMCTN